MTDLDEPHRFGTVDVSDALGVTARAWDQWTTGRELTGSQLDDATAVVVVGMGASGFAADVLAAVADEVLTVPVVVRKDARLPAFVGPRTLVLAVSYSGDTEETLDAVEQALRADARVVAVTSGGELAKRVADAGHPVIEVPGGHQPRHTIGWLAGALLACCGLDADVEDAARVQRAAAARCAPDVPLANNPAKRLGRAFAGCDLVVAWGTSHVGSALAWRLASQLNEHTKLPAYRSALPELAHNEVVGWEGTGGPERCGLVVLRDPGGETTHARVRVGPVVGQVRGRFAWVETFSTEPGPTVARLAGLSMLVDLASVYAAIARDVDPTPIGSIDRLKAALLTGEGGVR